ncbi:MAG: HAD family hydrolase [Candidatus Marinamargulisbacteria bacterium]|nr:HAD family hydrolase [Candidatus Marinamargulisbacteria bacterium]
MALRKALFLDRDGTLIEDVPYSEDPQAITLLPTTVPALKKAVLAGFLCIIITNQSGIARGLMTESGFWARQNRLLAILLAQGIEISDTLFCPHHPVNGVLPAYSQSCECRKPNPGMVLEAIQRHGIDPARSYMVGDKPSDVEAGLRAGTTGILIEAKAAHGDCPIGTSYYSNIGLAVDAILA